MKLGPQIRVSEFKPEPHLITPVVGDYFWKPRGGMWTSTQDEECCDWVRWLHDQGYTLQTPRWGGKLWLLQPIEANLAVVSTPRDLLRLHTKYPLELPERLSSIKSFDLLVDWKAVADDYDGIHVPNPRAHRLGYNLDDPDGGLAYAASLFFDTCDAESTCWFKWCFESEPELVELPHGVQARA